MHRTSTRQSLSSQVIRFCVPKQAGTPDEIKPSRTCSSYDPLEGEDTYIYIYIHIYIYTHLWFFTLGTIAVRSAAMPKLQQNSLTCAEVWRATCAEGHTEGDYPLSEVIQVDLGVRLMGHSQLCPACGRNQQKGSRKRTVHAQNPAPR